MKCILAFQKLFMTFYGVKGDMSQDDLADLLEEFGSDKYTESNGTYQADFNIEINVGESSYGIVPTEYNKIPVHDDNKEFKGRWKLVFDVNGEEKEFISNQTSEYTDGITKEVLESSNCNWRIKFQPQDERYKPLYIQANITINQL